MLYIFTTFFLLAAGITANKYVLQFLTPAWFVAFRMSLAGVILLIYNSKHLSRNILARFQEDWKILAIVSLCTTLVPSLLKAFGLKYMFAAKSTLLASIDPFITACYSYYLWNERLSWRKWLGIMFGCLGMVIIVLSRTPDEVSWQAFCQVSYPELAVIASVILSRYGWIQAQGLLKRDRYTPTQINGVVMLISGTFAFLIAWLDCDLHMNDIPLSTGGLVLFILSIVGANVIGYAMYGHCLKKHSSTLISLAGFLVPLLVAIFAYSTLNEPLPLSFVLAGLAIFAGLVMFYLDSRKSKYPESVVEKAT